MKLYKFILTFVITCILTTNISFAEDKISDEFDYVDKIFGYATELFIDDTLTKEEMFKKAMNKYFHENPEAVIDFIKAGFFELDEYSEFYTAEEFEGYVNDFNHTFYGIGVTVQKNGDYVEIISVNDSGSAVDAGVLAGDLIKSVDGVDAKGKSLDQVQKMIIGELGTNVQITFIRGSEEYSVTMTRKPVNDATVNYILLPNDVAYISIVNFAVGTADEFREVLKKLDEKNIVNIILDLRNNPGGYLDTAVEMAQMIVPKGVIVYTMFRQSENNKTYYSELEEAKYNFTVLVNANTASAAELLTSAMQDSGIAKVVGEVTYGKGVIQDTYSLRDTNLFKITTGQYITRNGNEINKIGVQPDYELANSTELVDVTKYETISFTSTSRFGDINDNIPKIKERLKVLGYSIENEGNLFDEELEACVLDFQITKDMKRTGELDTITMVAIENAFAKKEVYVDDQLYKAYELFGGTREELDKILYPEISE